MPLGSLTLQKNSTQHKQQEFFFCAEYFGFSVRTAFFIVVFWVYFFGFFWGGVFRARQGHLPRVVLTSQSLSQGEGVHGGPVVGGVLGLLGCLLVQVVHGAQRVHGVQRVAVHSIVLHPDINLKNNTQGRQGLRDLLLQLPGGSAELWKC